MTTRRRPGDPTRAIAYLRVSTNDQRLGPDAQRTAIEAWAAREHVTIVAWFTDLGVSGLSEMIDRPGLSAAIGAIRVFGAGLLVVAKRDRLARDVAIAALVEREVRRLGAMLAAADGIGNGSAPEDTLIRAVVDAVSAYELALIGRRTKSALAELKRLGRRVGTIPFGFEVGVDGALVPNADEQKIVATVRRLRAEGLSQRAIVSRLEAQGVVSRAGRPLQQTQVLRILRGPEPSTGFAT